MGKQHPLDLKSGQFVATGFYNIYRGATHDAIKTIFRHCHVAGAEPAVLEGLRSGLGIVPILKEYIISLDANLTGECFLRDRGVVFIKQLNFNTRQRLAYAACAPFSVIGIGYAHADFGHAIAF